MDAGFIGLGKMGAAMVQRLIEQELTVKVWNRTPSRAQALHLSPAASPAELVSEMPVVLLCLADSNAVELVLRGQDGLLAGDCAGKLIVDLSTNHHTPVALFHRLARQQGAAYLEAPVAGSVAPARQGALTIFTSGEREDHDRARPYLDLLARQVFYLGPAGLATRLKLANNLCLAVFMAGIAEAVAIAEGAGLTRERALELLGAGAGRSAVLEGKKQKLIDGDYGPQFDVGMMLKDLHALQDLAREQEQPLFAGGAARELYMRAVQLGLRDQDFSAVMAAVRGRR